MFFSFFQNGVVADFILEASAYSGVRKIAEKVREDVRLVTDVKPELVSEPRTGHPAVVIGTIGRSERLDALEQAGAIDLSKVRGKREVYAFAVIEMQGQPMLVIAGSDKRGTIYGLFHLSETLGVSPFVNWCHVWPAKRELVELTEADNCISREPSVKFRGFFINDEWPAFGNWVMKNFGGFNTKAYENIFELLLRLKGNYMWPAMWTSRFGEDGPGLANAELADELGVIMGMSHHEPCLRQGEDYKHLRGKDSIYGDAWNFRTNREGIIRFWEDGLKLRGKFENVITVGMRGEADTAILGQHATLADNIELLRDVLKVQRELIGKYVNEDLSQVPRMIALYKEVEKFFYGNEEAKGLIGCKELEDVILMLCDDNFGNLRTLPTEEMRKHPGGYGMYYHFDYHGWPISYEWVNSTHLTKVWEQMTMAYDFGIRDLWIVNVGDICTQEFPLAYFLDLAYDFDRWGTKAINQTEYYTRQWIRQQFGSIFTDADLDRVYDLVDGYTRIAQARRPEAMNADVYDPVTDLETERLLAEVERLLAEAEELRKLVPEKMLTAFISLIYYPAVADLNLYQMQLYAGLNHYYANEGAVIANGYGTRIAECLKRDREIVDEYHALADGKFYGMGLSQHIGFRRWNEDECQNPVQMHVFPANKPRLVVTVEGKRGHISGTSWLPNRLYVDAFLEPDVNETALRVYSISDLDGEYTIENTVPWITCSTQGGTVNGAKPMERIVLTIDRAQIAKEFGSDKAVGEFHITTPVGECIVEVSAQNAPAESYEKNTFLTRRGYASIEAGHYTKLGDGRDGAVFAEINGFGRTVSGLKAFPTTAYFTAGEDAPYVEYQIVTEEAGTYGVEIYAHPSNPSTMENTICYGIQCGDGEVQVCNIIPEGQRVDDSDLTWSAGVLDNIRKHICHITCEKGVNRIRIYAVTPGFALEKLVVYQEGHKPAETYLGPVETWYVGKN